MRRLREAYAEATKELRKAQRRESKAIVAARREDDPKLRQATRDVVRAKAEVAFFEAEIRACMEDPERDPQLTPASNPFD